MTPAPTPPALTLGGKVTLACLWEATAPKPGNVYRGADFADMTYADFVAAAAAIGPVFDQAHSLAIGQLVRDAVRAMRQTVGVNTHLGAILLLAPLAKASSAADLFSASAEVAAATTIDDARLAYEAIRMAQPGGLGKVDQADIRTEPTITLAEAMRLAADRDPIARQYGNNFSDVRRIAEQLSDSLELGLSLSDAIVRSHVSQMAHTPDGLIARKCGPDAAAHAAALATRALNAGPLHSEEHLHALEDLDFWLRADGHRRNPGSTADLVCAALLALLVQDRLSWPVRFYG